MYEETTINQTGGASVKSVAIRYGLITGIVTVIYSLILYMSDLNNNKWLSWISTAIMIVGIVMAHKHFKSQNGGFMTYGQGLGIGSLLSVVVGVLSGIFLYIYMKFIDSHFMERMQEAQYLEMEKRGMSDEQIEQAAQLSQKITGPEMMVVWAIIGTLFFGFILSLIISAFTKNTRPDFE